MEIQNKTNIKRRICFWAILVLFISCAGVLTARLLIKKDYRDCLWHRNMNKIEKLINNKIETIRKKTDSIRKPKLIDSPITPLSVDTNHGYAV